MFVFDWLVELNIKENYKTPTVQMYRERDIV